MIERKHTCKKGDWSVASEMMPLTPIKMTNRVEVEYLRRLNSAPIKPRFINTPKMETIQVHVPWREK